MPIHLPPISRRSFLAGFGGSLFLSSASEAAAKPADEALIVLLNDTHIGQKQPDGSPIPSHLRQTVRWVLDQPVRPAAVLINGDLALLDGQPGDYTKLLNLLRPLREAGIPLHLTLGNHDNREVFLAAIGQAEPRTSPVADKQVAVVETKLANFFMLDSLKIVNKAPGELGAGQLSWLAKEIDARPAKPAIIVAHHNPRLGGDPKHFPGGLEDSQPLWQMLAARKQVKAYIHGHIHHWSLAAHEGIHIINTPAVSYVGNPAISTTGWTTARLSDRRIDLAVRTHQPDHPWNGEKAGLDWR